MKTSLKVFSIVALGALLSPAFVHAADDTSPAPATDSAHPRLQQMRERRMKELDDALSLTADQKAQINAIWDKAEQGVAGDKEAKKQHRKERRQAMKAAHDEVRTVLTPEQQQKFDAMPRERPGMAGKKHKRQN